MDGLPLNFSWLMARSYRLNRRSSPPKSRAIRRVRVTHESWYARSLERAGRIRTSFPQAFTFARSNRSWGLADDGYVEQKAKEVCAACISGGVAEAQADDSRNARLE